MNRLKAAAGGHAIDDDDNNDNNDNTSSGSHPIGVSPLQVVVDHDYFANPDQLSRTVTQANRHTALINSRQISAAPTSSRPVRDFCELQEQLNAKGITREEFDRFASLSIILIMMHVLTCEIMVMMIMGNSMAIDHINETQSQELQDILDATRKQDVQQRYTYQSLYHTQHVIYDTVLI